MICTKSNVLLLMINGKKEFRKACKDDSHWLTELKRQKIKKANITFAAHCHKVNVLQKGVFYFHYIHDTVILNLLCFLFFFFFLFHRPCRGREPCHQLGQSNEVVDREAQRQTRWIKEAIWIRKTYMCMNRDAGSYQLSHTWDQVISRSRAPSSCK